MANVPRVSLFHAYSTMLLDSCLNGTILDAKFHNNLMVVVAILTTLRPCQICRHICITILHHYKHCHILSCILLCSLGIATTHYRSSFNWYIVVVVTIMHKLTPRVMLWLTCTNILWEYVVTNNSIFMRMSRLCRTVWVTDWQHPSLSSRLLYCKSSVA